ncbi:MAG: AAA-like domain-containing protein [Chroococcidiopsidaceae cyanobacterium CP_BM_RX_35]|nr:AAA-like domain-containing protein [Chroococcidiopsidaceae cyanobacterium CP_BM_RX_35]
MNSQPLPKTILILLANPMGTEPLLLEQEVREIQECIQKSRHRDRFVIKKQPAARPRDVQRAMLDCKPQIVHFCGHRAGDKGLILEDETGKVKPVSTTVLATLFDLFAEQVECVLLNACYSKIQAKAIARHINYVIGMKQAIGDRAAIEFATSFYNALGAGESVEFAFRLGKNAMQLAGIGEETIPVLVSRTSTQPKAASLSVPAASVPQVQPTPEILSCNARMRIFISYKRGVLPDEQVALAVFQALSEQHEVFIDQTMLVGTHWAERIEAELRRADFLISFLTKDSVNSEMVKGEIEAAHHLRKQQGQPAILPVRLTYRDPFAYPLSAYLNGINWAFWENPADTPRLIQELGQAVAGGSLSIDTERSKTDLTQTTTSSPFSHSPIPPPLPAAQPLPLEMPEGTMDPESQFYVERAADVIALGTIERAEGVTITIKGPRQMGKSSLLIRTKARAETIGKRVVYLDFQLFDRSALAEGEHFYRQFCEWLTEELEVENKVAEYWDSPLGNSQRCTRYMSRHVLKTLASPLVLAMDEVESVFDTEFRSDFFSMLRNWHNNRATTPTWKQLDLVLVTSTEPYQLIENLNQSPFNVGQVIELIDFDRDQVGDLNQRHGSPLALAQLDQLMQLLAGHPYLVRRALYLIASQQLTVRELFAQATADRGPFGDHLRYHLFRMNDKPELVQGLVEVIRQQRCTSEQVFFRLRGAGLVRREGQRVLPRCQLYADYFWEHLHG